MEEADDEEICATTARRNAERHQVYVDDNGAMIEVTVIAVAANRKAQ